MAKFLESDASLHGLAGGVPLASAVECGSMVCHNLVVDEFHTFFVGNSRLLVHDKTCPAPNVASIPGSHKVREPVAEPEAFEPAVAQAAAVKRP
jgi:hypothetical protein